MKKAATPSIGLALGAGGARGIAHISVLEALDELGLKPQRISGTSIGAIIGAGYASGLSGHEVRSFTLEVLGDGGRVLAKLMQLRPRRFREWFARGVLNAVQLDAERIVELFVPETLAQDFGDLSTPLSIIVTDFYGWSECEMTEGPLRPAIAASIAFPPLFQPVIYEGRVMVDGGMVNPLPVDRLSGCDIVIAVDVVSGPAPRGGRDIPTPMNAIFGAAQILMQSIISEKLRFDQPDILLRPDVNEFRVLDFLKADAILKAADPTKEKLKRCLAHILETL